MNDETFVNERVQVVVTFNDGLNLCVPRKFRRPNGKEVTVTELGLRHPTTMGKRTVHMFDVTDGGTDYRLEFDSFNLTWHLTWMGDRYE